MKSWEIIAYGSPTGWKVSGRTYYEALLEACEFFPMEATDLDVRPDTQVVA